ncbi:MAG TPA: prolyl oligopeptidase family serine peptidase [Vicinamibacterales bacterium]|nr:prolyl oligopeptidase family serine peptidase [Vicinamibacterales bacterium]
MKSIRNARCVRGAGWRLAATTSLTVIVMTGALGAQSSPGALAPPSPADFGQWERLQLPFAHGGLSPDGKWLAYGIDRTSRENELRVTRIADRTTKVIAFGSGPIFSADSKWMAAAVGYSEAQEEKMRKDKQRIERKLALLNLSTGDLSTIDAIETFAFSPDGSHLAMRGYAPEPPEKKKDDEKPAYDPPDEPGATLIVRDLASGRDLTFGSVGEFSWQTKGSLLAFTVAAEGHTGNGVQLFDPAAGRLRVLASSSSRYVGLVWRKDSSDLAVLQSRPEKGRDGAAWDLLAWTDAAAARETLHRGNADLAASQRVVAFRKPQWSEDGAVIFVGIGPWLETASTSADDSPAREEAEDDRADVDVWHPLDVSVMPKQKIDAKRDRERSDLAAWHVESGRIVRLGARATERVTPVPRHALAYALDWSSSALERSWGRFGGASLSLVDVETGKRTVVADHVDDRYVSASPGGAYLLFYRDGHYWTVNTTSGAVLNITRGIKASFVDVDSDSTDVTRPAFGWAGWLADDRAVLLYDKFDVWQVAPDGSAATRLTDGRGEQVQYRCVDLDAESRFEDRETAIDRSRPIFLELFGLRSKKSGYARLDPGSTSPERLVWLDREVSRLGKAKDADVFVYMVQSFEDSPDAFVGGAALHDAAQVTSTNPFQSSFAWGRAELVEYKNSRGVPLQGVLHYPAGYVPGRMYPMVVYMYEQLSDTLHRYSAPSERDYYNVSSFTSAGYFLYQPDIVFQPREPGLSVLDCVGAAVEAVIRKGVVDPKRIGIIGHSWGGFDASFLATHSQMFAAAVAGAPITDLVSNYGDHHWRQGIAETDHIETGQQRMVVPLWEDPNAYIRNSAVFGAGTMRTPLLVEVGDDDGTVFWHQGVELYNAARRARKNVVLLVYANEDHGLRKKANQIDYHRRIMAWFDHYLKGEPAPAWITEGVRYLDREGQRVRKSGS